jgi:hypothetical protein
MRRPPTPQASHANTRVTLLESLENNRQIAFNSGVEPAVRVQERFFGQPGAEPSGQNHDFHG